MILTYESIAKKIDHALLLPTMTDAEMVAGCDIARVYDVASVCIKPYAIPLAIHALHGSDVKVGTVVGFPHGGNSTTIKVAETIDAIDRGAVEIDMVVNIGAVLSGDWSHVESDIGQVSAASHDRGALIKVIFETCYLTDDQKIRLCEICSRVGVDYVKTSTGFGTGGAIAADLVLMKTRSPERVKLKASGGIKSLDKAIEFAELGSERLGLSRTAEILDELCVRLNLPTRNVSRETKPKSSGSDSY